MATSANGENVHCRDSAIDVAIQEAEFRKDKAKAKSNFNLLLMIEYQNLPCRTGIWNACHNMDICMEIVMELLSNCTTIYLRNNEIQKTNVVISEMEEIEKDFTAVYETAWVYLKSRVDDTSGI